MEAMRVYHELDEDGEVHLKDLPYKKGEKIELILIPNSQKETSFLTGDDLLNSGLVGLWSDRDDIEDSATYARQLRERAQRRER